MQNTSKKNKNMQVQGELTFAGGVTCTCINNFLRPWRRLPSLLSCTSLTDGFKTKGLKLCRSDFLIPPSGYSAISIALGESHTCAIVTGGGVKCWGYNDFGQLGIGSSSTQYSPQNVGLGGLLRHFKHLAPKPSLLQYAVCE